jgi:hypothetical protein
MLLFLLFNKSLRDKSFIVFSSLDVLLLLLGRKEHFLKVLIKDFILPFICFLQPSLESDVLNILSLHVFTRLTHLIMTH